MSLHVGAVGYRTTTRRLVLSFLITTGPLHVPLATRWFGSPRGIVRNLEGNFDKENSPTRELPGDKGVAGVSGLEVTLLPAEV